MRRFSPGADIWAKVLLVGRKREFRATLDAGLARILKGDRSAILSQLSDPKALTPAEREAAFSPAGEPFHLIWIQS